MGEITLEKLHEDLRSLKKAVDDIRENMVDADSVLSYEESKELDESIKRYEEGKTKSLEDVEKDLGDV